MSVGDETTDSTSVATMRVLFGENVECEWRLPASIFGLAHVQVESDHWAY